MKHARNRSGRIATTLAMVVSLIAAPALAQDMPSTADLFALPAIPLAADELVFQTTAEQMAPLLAPVQQLQSSLTAGSATIISQVGRTNEAYAGVNGVGSLAVISQSGNNNKAVHAIQGNNSAMLLVQSGNNNSVIQASQGNDNTQLLGVSGTNNEVAYLQVGNELSGAMNVGGKNSAVFALQTPSSNNYMMPTGLKGLENQVVVIVPGRMYVFNRDRR